MRTAIVTGGSRGIGKAIASAIVAGGGRVMISGTDEARVAAAVNDLSRAGGDRVAGVVADVRSRASVDRLVAETAQRFGGFDTLINNAGIGRFAEVAAMTDDDWRDVLETNLTGAFYCSRAALPWLTRAGGGWIVCIASLAGSNPFATGAAYCASKAGLIAFTEALMQEVRQQGVRVSVVLPGSVETDFGHPDGSRPAGDRSWKLSPDDVAEAVVDLLRHPARSLPSRVEIRPARPKPRT